ncbi:MAG: Bax inhibitor-1 family protein [Phycisphaerales bacterium]|nr:Bax inhibitor-1 family protein [Phycisphaerales bacterium]MDP7087501.1 Bax inhibitor-1 family protein [Phycisphaerales bacterium]MDP7188809.1 Bax inhibitor-1 family protein [Phycisphaerales bacterium]MDP7520519.1 Bax inhibitor-1 family protein [Phycisphaerales bacterium]MDP7573610.1 Bax inhibitor-1 family protein [Phycisphaerales bacterium]
MGFESRDYMRADARPAREATGRMDAARVAFLRRTYLHLAGAIVAFVVVESLLLRLPFISSVVETMAGSGMTWLLVLGLFMGVAYGADRLARSTAGAGVQYLGLGLYVVAEALIFAPLLYIATRHGGDGILSTAAIVTFGVCGALTAYVLISGVNFSWLRGVVAVGGIAAMLTIVGAIIFGFSLGVFFAGLMIMLAASMLLYQTSAAMHKWRTDQHVAAALGLFASVMLMFYYVVVFLMGRD